jgi:hypothetical protein
LAQPQIRPRPIPEQNPKGYPLPLLQPLTPGPHLSSPSSRRVSSSCTALFLAGRSPSPSATLAPTASNRAPINTPGAPLSSPFAPSRSHRRIAAGFLARPPQYCELIRSNSMLTVTTSPSPYLYPLRLYLAHSPDPFPSS